MWRFVRRPAEGGATLAGLCWLLAAAAIAAVATAAVAAAHATDHRYLLTLMNIDIMHAMKHLQLVEQPCCAPGAPLLPKGRADALAARFKALADPARVEIVNRLAGDGEVCVCQLTGPLGLSQPTVSYHLKALRDAGLVEVAAKRGTWTYYRLVPDGVEALAFALGGPGPRALASRRRRAAG